MLPFKSRPGAVEPLSLVALVLLVVTLVVGTAVTSNTKKSFEVRREASVLLTYTCNGYCAPGGSDECGSDTCGTGTCATSRTCCAACPTATLSPTATSAPTPTPVPSSTCSAIPDAHCVYENELCDNDHGTLDCGEGRKCCATSGPTPTRLPTPTPRPTSTPTPTPVPSGGGGTQPTPTPVPNTCSYTCTSSGICSAEGGTAIVSQVCGSGSTCCSFPEQQPSSPQPTPTPAGQSPPGGVQPTPTPAWTAPQPTAAPGSTTTVPITPPTTSSSGQCFWGASTCDSFGRYSGSGCTNCPSGVASCCGSVIPASVDACRNSVGQHVDTRCVSSTRVAVCRSDKSGYNTQDCAGGWSCSASLGRCAPPPTPTPSLNFNPQTALTPQGTYTVNPVSPTFDTLNPSNSIDYKKYEDACKGKTSGTVCGIDGQAGTCSQGAVPLCETGNAPIGSNLVQYRNLAQQAEAAVMGTVSNLPLVGPNRIYQSLQIAASGSQYSIEVMPSDPYGIAGVEVGAVDVALAHYAGLTEIVDASNRLFYQTGLSESQAQEYNAYVANRFGDAATVGAFAVGTAAQITSPFINPQTIAGKPISSTYNAINQQIENKFLGGLGAPDYSLVSANEAGLVRTYNSLNYPEAKTSIPTNQGSPLVSRQTEQIGYFGSPPKRVVLDTGGIIEIKEQIGSSGSQGGVFRGETCTGEMCAVKLFSYSEDYSVIDMDSTQLIIMRNYAVNQDVPLPKYLGSVYSTVDPQKITRGYAMEIVQGQSLYDLRMTGITQAQANAAVQTLNQYHALTGLPHGDLFSKNIIFTPEGRVVFLDPLSNVLKKYIPVEDSILNETVNFSDYLNRYLKSGGP